MLTSRLAQWLRLPVLRIERIYRLFLIHPSIELDIVPHRRELIRFSTIDHEPTARTEWPGYRKDVSRWTSHNLRLKPTMLRAFTRMQLPRGMRSNRAQGAYLGVLQCSTTHRAPQGSFYIELITGFVAHASRVPHHR